MDNNQNFDSLDLQQLFENLPEDKKVEFLKDLKGVVTASDQYLGDVERIIGETIKEFQDKKPA
ncbi:hypothetical protein HKL94_00145 [Candidatus Parcubacteria bacterium]|nr:hypothetical protein [Candidatus Parcubacteria bacterium]